jgi:sigma-B regulation protein RsbU (phosphoserine phosphatase)
MGYTDAPSLVYDVNRQFWESSLPEHYATLFFARYDPEARELHYVNAGHLPALVIRNGGEVQRLEATSMPVGVFTSWSSREHTFELRPSDTVVIYSDGISEAGMYEREEFGESRIVTSATGQSAAAIVENVCLRVAAYSPDQHDDCTVLAMRCM